MIIKDQLVDVIWNPTTRSHYESFGYKFTKYKDHFQVEPNELMPTSTEKVLVECDECGEIQKIQYGSYNANINRNGKYICLKCSNAKTQKRKSDAVAQTRINQLNDFCEENGYIPLSTVKDYKNAKEKLYYICPKHGVQYTTGDQLQRGTSGCNACGNEKIGRTNSFSQEEVDEIISSKNNNSWLNYGEYINNHTNNLEILCASCGESYTTSMLSYKYSYGLCPSCSKKKIGDSNRLTEEEVIARICNNKILNPQDYISRGVANLQIECCDCGEVYITSLGNYEFGHQFRCKKCAKKISSLERIVMDFLDFCHIDYEYNKKFEDCKDIAFLPFDFYLPDYNLIIETDGQGHYEPMYSEESFLSTILHDGMKNNYCRWNNIDLLRIPYWEGENIEKIISEYLQINYRQFYQKIEYIPSSIRRQVVDEEIA